MEFEDEVMHKLGRLEQGMEDLKKLLLDNGTPGFISQTRNRLTALELQDYRRTWIERMITGTVAIVASALTTLGIRWVGHS